MAFLLIILLAFSMVSAQDGPDTPTFDTLIDSLLMNPEVVGPKHLNNPEYLPHELFRDRILRRDLALMGSENAQEDPLYRSLMSAAVLYYDGKWDSAYHAYHVLRSKVPENLQGQLLMRQARCRLEQGRYADVRQILMSWQSLRSNIRWWEQADRILLESILRNPEIKPVAKADSVLVRLHSKPSPSYTRLLRLKRAQLLELSGDTLGAKDMHASLLSSGGSTADSAFRELHRLEPRFGMPTQTQEQMAYTQMLCRKGYHRSCIEKTNSLLKSNPKTLTKNSVIQLWSDQATAYQGLSKSDSAIQIYQYLLDSIDYRSSWMQAAIRLLRKSGKRSEAARLDSIFQEKFPYSNENANNLWVKALELEQQTKHDSAKATYGLLTDSRFKNSSKRHWARFRIGLIHFKDKQYDSAAVVFRMAADERTSIWSRSGSLFFLAECLRQQSQDSLARLAYLETIADFPLSYYAHRARQNLKDLKLLDEKDIPQLGSYDLPEDSLQLWLRNLSKKSSVSDTTFSPGRIKLVGQLLRASFTEEAMELYEESRKFHAKRPEFLFEYSRLFLENGEIALGFSLARQFLNVVDKEEIAKAPLTVLRVLYPLPYRRQVVTRANPGLDPLFVYSVMRQESIFNSQISSPVGARGLLQIMPRTGIALAKQENLQGFSVDLLFNPFMNIRLGTRYMRDLLQEYDNDPMYTLANYNAGPAPARRWKKTHAHLPWDLRAEEISYWETRDYVKKVMGNYWTYQSVWASQ